MSYIQKSKIKAFVNSKGVRVSPEAFDGINRQIEALMEQMVDKVKADGMKTLMSQHTGVTKTESKSSVHGRMCQRCCNVDDAFLSKAANEQKWFYQEVVICANHYNKNKKYDPKWATKNGRINNFVNGVKV
jgi:hypothetical protein